MFRRKHEPRIYDTFIFGDELDILECRLTEYADSKVYRHVIVEANVDHQGHPKPFYFLENKERFAPFMDRITYIQMTDLNESVKALDLDAKWQRIYNQRNALALGLKDANKDDVILFSDADEIMQPEGIEQALECTKYVQGLRWYQRHAIFCVDWEEQGMPWKGPIGVTVRNAPKELHMIRDYYGSGGHAYYGAGWHLSWLGGHDAIKKKVSQYCHPELDKYILDNLAEGRLIEKGYYWGADTVLGLERKLTPVQVDKEWPRWITEGKCPRNWFREYYQVGLDTQDLR